MKPLIFRTSRVLPPPAAKDSVRVTADSSTTSYRDERCACAGPISATPIATVAKVRRRHARLDGPTRETWLHGRAILLRWRRQRSGRPGARRRRPGRLGLTVTETRHRRLEGRCAICTAAVEERRRRGPGHVSRSVRRHAGAGRVAADRQGRADAVPARSVRDAHQEADDGDRKGRPLPRSARADPPGRRLLDAERQPSPAGDEEARREEHHRRCSCRTPRWPSRSSRSTPRRRTTSKRSRSRRSAWRAPWPPT